MINLRTGYFIILVLFLLVSTVIAQDDSRFDFGNSALKIPFKLWNNHIYLQTSVNGSKRLWLLLDTGAVNLIHHKQAEQLGLKLETRGRVGGVGDEYVDAWSTENVSFALPGVTFSNQKIMVMDLGTIETCVNRIIADSRGTITRRPQPTQKADHQPIDGILGNEFFKEFVVEIDYASKFINLYDPKNYNYTGTSETIPLEFSGVHVFVRAPITVKNRSFPSKRFMIDTGSVLALILNEPFVGMNELLEQIETTKPQEVCGIGGNAQTVIGTTESISLKNHKLENLVTLFSQAKSGVLARTDFDGIIGNAVLRRFRVIFDYSRRSIILEKYQE